MPATLMGIESNGMVLAASHEGTVSLLTLDKDVPSGSGSSSVRALLGETFRLLATHLNLFTLISLTVWLPGHVLPELPRVLRARGGRPVSRCG